MAGRMRIAGATDRVHKVFTITGLDRALEMFPTLADVPDDPA